MAASTPQKPAAGEEKSETRDPTFRHYKPSQALTYAEGRMGYSPELYEFVLRWHLSSPSATLTTLLDIGCGPALATLALAPSFTHAIGLDPGAAMIDVAKARATKLGTKTNTGEEVVFVVGEAEKAVEVLEGVEFGGGSEKGVKLKVDLITVATAVHWFDMPKFWDQAAQLLRPGGTVALWTRGPAYAHPAHPHATALNNIQKTYMTTLEPHFTPGNLLSHNLYDELPLPWTPSSPTTSPLTATNATAFPQTSYERYTWDRTRPHDEHGVATDDFLGGSVEMPLKIYERALETVSAVGRWREVNAAREEGEGRERDVVEVVIERVREVLKDGDVKGVRGGTPTVLLLFRRA